MDEQRITDHVEWAVAEVMLTFDDSLPDANPQLRKLVEIAARRGGLLATTALAEEFHGIVKEFSQGFRQADGMSEYVKALIQATA